MKSKDGTHGSDIIGALPALRRASRRALQLSIETNTPFLVMQNGKMINANPFYKGGSRNKKLGKIR